MLTKQPLTTYVPAIPGQAAVPPTPEVPPRRVCGSSTSGAPTQVCSFVRLWFPDGGGGVSIPPGTQYTVEGVENGRAYVDCFVCRTQTGTNTGFITCTTVPGTPATPGSPAVPGTPARVDVSNNLGWNAGAHSYQQLDDDVQVRFVQPKAVGVVTGFVVDDSDPTDLESITHGFYFFQSAGGSPLVRIFEAGRQIGAQRLHDTTAEHAIVRREGIVSYRINGATIYVSTAASTGPVRVGTRVYSTGDQVPSTPVDV